jgi:hypothetical protein
MRAQQLKAGIPHNLLQWRGKSQTSRRKLGNFRKYGSMFSSNCELFQHSRTARTLPYQRYVTLKIEKLAGEHGTTLKLIGRIRAEHLAELRGQIASSAPSVLELREVTLVDAEVVRFLSACESEGIQLQHCSAYIREWIVRERESSFKG